MERTDQRLGRSVDVTQTRLTFHCVDFVGFSRFVDHGKQLLDAMFRWPVHCAFRHYGFPYIVSLRNCRACVHGMREPGWCSVLLA